MFKKIFFIFFTQKIKIFTKISIFLCICDFFSLTDLKVNTSIIKYVFSVNIHRHCIKNHTVQHGSYMVIFRRKILWNYERPTS